MEVNRIKEASKYPRSKCLQAFAEETLFTSFRRSVHSLSIKEALEKGTQRITPCVCASSVSTSIV